MSFEKHERIPVTFTINGKETTVMIKPHARLLDVIRDDLRLTGTKEGCSVGECGACTVIVDGKAVTACLVPGISVEGRKVVTIEGVADGEKLHPIQEQIIKHNALQCGFCIPGFIMSAKALLDANPDPTKEEIRRAISGNLCRCTGYEQLVEAIYDAAQDLKAAGLSRIGS